MRAMSFPFGAYAYGDIMAAAFIVAIAAIFFFAALHHRQISKYWEGVSSSVKFLYVTFIKPHSSDSDDTTGQQAALEGFYKAQVV